MADTQIAPTTQAQLGAVLDQARATFEDHRARHPKQFPETTLFKLEERHKDAVDLQGEHHLSFTAQRASASVGFVLLRKIGVKAGMIYDIGVYPDARRQGFGLALLHHAVATADAYGWDRLFASVWDGNTASHQMFQSAGFSPQKPLFGKLSAFFAKDRVTLYAYNLKEMPRRSA